MFITPDNEQHNTQEEAETYWANSGYSLWKPSVEPRCKNCGFWGRKPAFLEWGVCKNDAVDETTAGLYNTKNDFGCVYFEVKDGE